MFTVNLEMIPVVHERIRDVEKKIVELSEYL